ALVLDVFIRANYPNIVTYIPNAGDATQKFAERKGIMSHTNSKYDAVMNMRYLVGEKRCVHINDKDTIRDYKNFKRRSNGTWGADDDETDDRVFSLMWALMILDPKIAKEYFEIVESDPQGKPLKILPNFDTYISSSDMVFPNRFRRGQQSNPYDFSKYQF